MDDHRFDDLARLLASHRSRRSFLRAAAGAAVAGLLARPAAVGAAPGTGATRKHCRVAADCNDGNACTTNSCVNNACRYDPVVCTAIDQCHAVGVCEPATGLCSNPAKPDGTSCEDGNACTTGDTCRAGVCTGTPVVCAADACHDAGVCDPATGLCSNPEKPDGTSCSDNNACTNTDTCRAGVCTPGTERVCPALGPCWEAGICNPTTGRCEYTVLPNDTHCDDGNPCTTGDTCRRGVCAGTPLVCDGDQVCQGGECITPVCGDGVCNGSETCATCPDDCGLCECTTNNDCVPNAWCHATWCVPVEQPGELGVDGACDGWCRPYTLDCGQGYCACLDGFCAAVMVEYCGDGVCSESETCSTCPEDCGQCQCTTDADCVPDECCHASWCTPIAQAPICDGVTCDTDCDPLSMDCGQGSCGCVDGLCAPVYSN